MCSMATVPAARMMTARWTTCTATSARSVTTAGSGRDRLYGQGGNDLLFGEGDDDLIDVGAGTGDLIDYGTGESGVPGDFVPPTPTPPPTVTVTRHPAARRLAAHRRRLSRALDRTGRFGHRAGTQRRCRPVAGTGDRRRQLGRAIRGLGRFAQRQFRDLRRPAHGRRLAGAGRQRARQRHQHRARLLAPARASRLDSHGQPVVAWTQIAGRGRDIRVARFDPAANGGLGAWVALGTSLDAGGISGTGSADYAQHRQHAGRPGRRLAGQLQRHRAGLCPAIHRRKLAGVWAPAGRAAGDLERRRIRRGSGVGQRWRENRRGLDANGRRRRREIYLREFSGGTWNELGGSASGGGLSNTAGDSGSPTLAYHAGSLFAAWRDNTTGPYDVYAVRYDGAAWVAGGQRCEHRRWRFPYRPAKPGSRVWSPAAGNCTWAGSTITSRRSYPPTPPHRRGSRPCT